MLGIDLPAFILFARRVGPPSCLQAVCMKALAHSHGVLAHRWAYSHRALADTGPCLQARGLLFASRYNYRYQYYLTPTAGSGVAFEEPSLEELARVIKSGACIEASFQRGKGEVGMDEYQVRTWPGWHHHMVLSLLAVWFLITETHRGQSLTPALTLPQVRYGLSLLLLEGFYRPGVD